MSAPAPGPPDAAVVAIGVDVGGTHLRVATVDRGGRVVARESTRRPAGETPVAFGDGLVEALREQVADLPSDVPVGVGIAGVVGPGGRMIYGPNLPVEGLDLQDRLCESLQRPVTVVNDATAACLAESRAGAAAGCADVVLLTLGTGVGGGAVVGGRLLRGASGGAGEFGHLVVADGGRPCPCGNHGCLEAYASGRAIGEIASEQLAAGRTSRALAGAARLDASAVSRAAEDGDPLAREVLEETGRWLGVGLASLVNAFDPAVLVIGGGAGQALGDQLFPTATAAMGSRVLGHRGRTLPEVRLAELGDDAGVVGAALLAASDDA